MLPHEHEAGAVQGAGLALGSSDDKVGWHQPRLKHSTLMGWADVRNVEDRAQKLSLNLGDNLVATQLR